MRTNEGAVATATATSLLLLLSLPSSPAFAPPSRLIVSPGLGQPQPTTSSTALFYSNGPPPPPPTLPDTSDPYALFGLSRGASAVNVKSAYRRLTRLFHPDAILTGSSTDAEKKRANDNFARINAAYEELTKVGDAANAAKVGNDSWQEEEEEANKDWWGGGVGGGQWWESHPLTDPKETAGGTAGRAGSAAADESRYSASRVDSETEQREQDQDDDGHPPDLLAKALAENSRLRVEISDLRALFGIERDRNDEVVSELQRLHDSERQRYVERLEEERCRHEKALGEMREQLKAENERELESARTAFAQRVASASVSAMQFLDDERERFHREKVALLEEQQALKAEVASMADSVREESEAKMEQHAKLAERLLKEIEIQAENLKAQESRLRAQEHDLKAQHEDLSRRLDELTKAQGAVKRQGAELAAKKKEVEEAAKQNAEAASTKKDLERERDRLARIDVELDGRRRQLEEQEKEVSLRERGIQDAQDRIRDLAIQLKQKDEDFLAVVFTE